MNEVFEQALGKDLMKFLEFNETETHIAIKPKQYLHKDTWREIHETLRSKFQAVYDNQTWVILKTNIPKPKAIQIDEMMPKDAYEGVEPIHQQIENKQLQKQQIKPAYYPQFNIDKIISPTDPLRVDISEDIGEMMQQINAAGRILEHLIGRPHPHQHGEVELAAGARRLLAARRIGLKTVPMMVMELSDEEFDKIRLLENIGRKDLTDFELGKAFHKLQQKYNYTHEQIGDFVGKDRSFVSQKIEHYETIEQVKPTLLRRNNVEKPQEAVKKLEQLTSTQTRVIRQAPKEKQPDLIKQTIEQDLTPKELTQKIKPTEVHIDVPTDEDTEESTERKISETKPKPKAIDTGLVFTCSECGRQFTIIHVNPSLHRFQPVTVRETN